MNIIIIVGAVFLVLWILSVVLERFGGGLSVEKQRGLSRIILPLVFLLLVLQIIKELF